MFFAEMVLFSPKLNKEHIISIRMEIPKLASFAIWVQRAFWEEESLLPSEQGALLVATFLCHLNKLFSFTVWLVASVRDGAVRGGSAEVGAGIDCTAERQQQHFTPLGEQETPRVNVRGVVRGMFPTSALQFPEWTLWGTKLDRKEVVGDQALKSRSGG